MTSVYTALSAGVSCAVSRAWPQRDPLLPSLTFRLRSWSRSPDGSALAVLAVLIRAQSPGACDEFFAQAEGALTPLGFLLTAASDEVEEDTGFFLKDLDFSVTLGGTSAPVSAPLALSVAPVSAFLPVGGLNTVAVKPASRTLVPVSALSQAAVPFSPGPATLETLTASGEWLPADVGQNALIAAFGSASPLTCRLERGALTRTFKAHVRDLAWLPSGFHCALQVVPG